MLVNTEYDNGISEKHTNWFRCRSWLTLEFGLLAVST